MYSFRPRVMTETHVDPLKKKYYKKSNLKLTCIWYLGPYHRLLTEKCGMLLLMICKQVLDLDNLWCCLNDPGFSSFSSRRGMAACVSAGQRPHGRWHRGHRRQRKSDSAWGPWYEVKWCKRLNWSYMDCELLFLPWWQMKTWLLRC